MVDSGDTESSPSEANRKPSIAASSIQDRAGARRTKEPKDLCCLMISAFRRQILSVEVMVVG